MASFARSALPPRRREWTVEEHALFAARKEFELLRLLSTDKKALAAARRLGLSTIAGHPQSHPQPPAAARAARPPQQQQQVSVEPRRNARRRRSAERSARRHACMRLRATRSRTIAIVWLFVFKLRRRVRLRRDLQDLEELESARPFAVKRGPEGEPHSSSASSCDPQDFDHHHVLGVVRTSTRVSHLAKRFGGDAERPLLK
jgi:hypothetical protein